MVYINVTMTSDEICEILNTNKRNLKSIQARGKLEDRLIKAGYRLMKQLKEGRNNIYEIEQITDITWNEYQTSRNISDNKKEDHTKYTEYRITSGLKEPRTQVISESMSDISSRTAKRYDDILVEDNIIEFDQTVYFIKNTKTGEWTQVDRDGYKRFWANCSEATYYLNENYRRFRSGEIPRSTYEDTAYAIKDGIANEQGEIALKFNTYKEAENTKRILSMIKNRYTNGKSYNII